MTPAFAAAMRRATELTRAHDPVQATRLIQDALFGRLPSTDATPPNVDRLLIPKHAEPSKSQSEKMHGARLLRPLSEVVKTLKEGRSLLGDAVNAKRVVPDVPEGAQFLARHYSSKHGDRSFKLFVPAGGKPRGLIVMLHGCKQNPDDFAVGTKMNLIAAAQNFIVAYPSQDASANASRCWNWFSPAHQMRERGEPAILAGLTRELALEFQLTRDQVFVAGLSAGGAMAAVLLETYPDVYGGAAIHSGLAVGSANDVMSAFAAMRGDDVRHSPRATRTDQSPIRMIVFHGSADKIVHPRNAGRILQSRVDSSWTSREESGEFKGRRFIRKRFEKGSELVESWAIEDGAHAWSGGDPRGSYASASGPDASLEISRFFFG